MDQNIDIVRNVIFNSSPRASLNLSAIFFVVIAILYYVDVYGLFA